MQLRHIVLFLVAVLFNSFVFAQSRTNFEVIDSLVNNSTINISHELNKDKVYSLYFDGAASYSVLKTSVQKGFQDSNIKIVLENESNSSIHYNLDEAKISYTEIFKDGILGDFLVERKSFITGKYSTSSAKEIGKLKEFEYTNTDTVSYSNLSELENIAYPFTSAQVPGEPFFSSILEPAIAIGTAAIAVYLFFNIRSK